MGPRPLPTPWGPTVPLDPTVQAAIVASIPTTLGLLLSNRRSRRTEQKVEKVHAEVSTNHGIRNGSRIENLGDDMVAVRQDTADLLKIVATNNALLIEHLKDPAAHSPEGTPAP